MVGYRDITSTNFVGRDVNTAPYMELSEYGSIVDKHINTVNTLGKGFFIDKYVIMPNHIHMIITVNNSDGAMWKSHPTNAVIPNLICSFKTVITKEIGFSIWQSSYYDHIIRNEKDYLRIWQYIEDNPTEWAEDEYYCND